jgi:MFS family permease
MGIFKDVQMTKNEYNQLFMLFYAGYLIALWPGAWISQRVGHKCFITGSLFLWALLLGVHPAVKTGKQMMAVRFLLGMVRLWKMEEFGLTSSSCVKLTCCSDRIADRAINSCPPSSILSAKKEPLGAATLVGFWKPRQCSPDNDIV